MFGFYLSVAAEEFTRYTDYAYIISGSVHRATRVVHLARPLNITDFRLSGIVILFNTISTTCFIINVQIIRLVFY